MVVLHKVLKRFVKDFKLPIQIVQEPYFSYFINLYNEQYNTKAKLKMLNNTLSNFESGEAFLDEYFKIRDNIIKTIEDTENYKQFINGKMDIYNFPNNNYPSRDVFNMGNINRYFISIDLKKANFQALRYFDKEIVLNCSTYEELISKFTDEKTFDYFKGSKYLRQVIFGNMNCKRQCKIQRYMTEQIINLLIKDTDFQVSDIKMVCNDEIILQVAEEKVNLLNSNDITNMITDKLGFDIDIEIYKLENIKGSKDYFVKKFINKNGYELMCIPLVYHAQIYKAYNDMPLNENDLVFYYENQVCRFLEPLNLESKVNIDDN